MTGKATYVLVHGGGHGGWCWRDVARILRGHGYEVHAPTLTGVADRRHLLTTETGLDTHIDDVASLLFHEDLHDVILAGHSYGGAVIAGAADRARDRVGQLAFLDAVILRDGESLAGTTPALRDLFAHEGRTVDGVALTLWPDSAMTRPIYGIEDEAVWEWMRPRLSPHPWKCFTDPLALTAPEAVAAIARTIVNCPGTLALRAAEVLPRYRDAANVWQIDTGHDLMLTEPEKTAEMLLRLA